MKEFTSTVTLTFDINNIEASDNAQKQYIKLLKEQYLDLYNVYLKEVEISNIQEED